MKNEVALAIESVGPIGSAIVPVGLLVDIQENDESRILIKNKISAQFYKKCHFE